MSRVKVAQQNGELIAAQAGCQIVFAQRAAQTFADQTQQRIPNGMAQRVVDRFEAVQVEEDDGNLLQFAGGYPPHCLIQMQFKGRAVGDPG